MKNRYLVTGGSGLLGSNWSINLRKNNKVYSTLNKRKIYSVGAVLIK